MSNRAETFARLTDHLNTLRLPSQSATSLRHLATLHAIAVLPPSSLDGQRPFQQVHDDANHLANTFIIRYGAELWPGSTFAEVYVLTDRAFQVFLQLLQLPINVPSNELVRELAPAPDPALPAPTATGQRRVVSAPEELLTRQIVPRPQTMEERVAALAERDRELEGLWQDEDVDPGNGVDDTLESADFEDDGGDVEEYMCQMDECGQKCKTVDELSHHYDKVHPTGAEEGQDGKEDVESEQFREQVAHADRVAEELAGFDLEGSQSDEEEDNRGVKVVEDEHEKNDRLKDEAVLGEDAAVNAPKEENEVKVEDAKVQDAMVEDEQMRAKD